MSALMTMCAYISKFESIILLKTNLKDVDIYGKVFFIHKKAYQ